MLIVGVMEVINLAHGSLFALGAYIAMEIVNPGWLSGPNEGYRGLPLPLRYGLALLVAPIWSESWEWDWNASFAEPTARRPSTGCFSPSAPRSFSKREFASCGARASRTCPSPRRVNGSFMVGDLVYSKYRFFASILGIVFMGLTWAFLEKTPYGARVKAGAHDSEMVRALGINISRLRLFVFAFGTALAAVAGIILTPIWGLRPHVGVDAVIPAFLIIVLGGVGSFWGAVIAGLLVGITVGITGGYAAEWSVMSMYLLLILVLSFRARGLMGKKSALEA